MAIIKSYTDIEQSRKLAEILPLESADMKWYFWKDEIDVPKLPTFGYSKDAAESYKDTEAVYLPCWSVAALLEVIRNNGRYELQMYEGGYYFEANGFMTESYFNPIDACYEMILKLKENNLI